MYLKISRIIILILMLIPSFTWAQQCRDYACVIAKVEKLMKQTQKDYKAILDNLDSAEGYPDSKAEQIRGLRRRVFVLIENEKNEAKKARDEAKKEKDRADLKTKETEQALLKSDSLFKVVENQKRKAQAVLDKIYFYDGKFGLAYSGGENGRYGFIDKDLFDNYYNKGVFVRGAKKGEAKWIIPTFKDLHPYQAIRLNEIIEYFSKLCNDGKIIEEKNLMPSIKCYTLDEIEQHDNWVDIYKVSKKQQLDDDAMINFSNTNNRKDDFRPLYRIVVSMNKI